MRATTTVATAATAGFVLLAAWVQLGPTWFDVQLHGWVLTHRSTSSISLAKTVTAGGSIVFVPTVFIGGLLLSAGRAWRRISIACAVTATVAIGLLLRLAVSDLVGRQRPSRVDWAAPAHGFAFPSGHTTTATLLAGVFAYALTRHLHDRAARIAVWSLAAACGAAVGWSRVWLGVHWPTDVIGGWLLGVSWLATLRLVMASVASRRGWASAVGRPTT